jgi:uncharacterized membrane protein HdeD (DUF308 family)
MLVLARNWSVVVLRGVLALLFGVLAYIWPRATIASFVILFGAYALLDGIFSLVAAFRPPAGESRGMLVLRGVLGVLAGLAVLAAPGLSAILLLYVIAIWAIAAGFAEIGAAIALRRVLTGEWLLALSGVLSILLGIYMLARPAAGLLALVWAIALYAIIAGIMLIILGFRLRTWYGSQGGTSVGGARRVPGW